MKKAKGLEYAPRDKPKKRPGKHKKSLSKSEKKNNKNKKYKGQGKGWQFFYNFLIWLKNESTRKEEKC